MELPFVTVDVFTQKRFRGNTLAIVTIPATGTKPTQEQKQIIAREFNLSETVFLHDVQDPATNKTRRIDIFMPTAEMTFAGHPTLGTAVTLLDQGVDTIVTKAGPIPVKQTSPGVVQLSLPFEAHMHAKKVRDLSLAESKLPSDEQIRRLELDAPVFSIVSGVHYVLVELPSLELLASVEQPKAELPADDLLDKGRTGFLGRYYYVRQASTKDEQGQAVVSFRARMLTSTFEDPATGSASCCLAAYVSTVADKQDTPNRKFVITQGAEMGKEAQMSVEIVLKDSVIDDVKLAGTAVPVMRGAITL
ncbi:Phenazine biosynthesis PhzC/PhzF protein [Drechmeria coniospora]|uniref:Phenazine biosynthesis PhzC/PhzF protein n=1 Tax=Drechmeria coniospora TaxID=98403 RepID=A0A151GYK4_DRECN|nr:Phenazine biosynthesis PhzC/PhzF protein [Drechmeria coniospora]KYK62113.1 Phenazine biosynthesis PhzC/PhzF protein [Drechmeria coniospora]ODA81346.1 hypothetical protein RJ55_04311 [Drechmeria coniospora]